MIKLTLSEGLEMNCYILENAGECYIIDPGCEKEKIQAFVHEHGWQVKGILLTHGHADHIGALDCFSVPVYVHEAELTLLKNDDYNGFNWLGTKRGYNWNDINIVPILDNSELLLGDKKIKTIHTPGHTPGSVCYQFGQELYSGDTLFAGGVGRWDFPLGNLGDLQKSVIKLLDNQGNEMIVCPGHDMSTNIGLEKKNNSYYLNWSTMC